MRDFARDLEDEFAGACERCGKSNYDCRCALSIPPEVGVRTWTCCDPNGVTFCVGCGADIHAGRPLPSSIPSAPTAKGGIDV